MCIKKSWWTFTSVYVRYMYDTIISFRFGLGFFFGFDFYYQNQVNCATLVIWPKSIFLSEIDDIHSKVSFICYLHTSYLLIPRQYSCSMTWQHFTLGLEIELLLPQKQLFFVPVRNFILVTLFLFLLKQANQLAHPV